MLISEAGSAFHFVSQIPRNFLPPPHPLAVAVGGQVKPDNFLIKPLSWQGYYVESSNSMFFWIKVVAFCNLEWIMANTDCGITLVSTHSKSAKEHGG